MKIFIIDIDGTICENIKNEEGLTRMRKTKPFIDSIQEINELYALGITHVSSRLEPMNTDR